jgi:hypothetical protein
MSAVVLDSQDFKNIIYLTKQAGRALILLTTLTPNALSVKDANNSY